jgi:hypothetical protein
VVVSSTGPVNKIRVDNAGEAVINLPSGSYDFTITSRGFQKKTETVNIGDQASQILEVKLAIDPNHEGYSGPVVDQSIIPEEHAAPSVQLPLTQLPLRIMVKDLSGAFIPQATIEVRSSESGTTTKIRADAQGHAILLLDSGSYSVAIQSPGFATWRGNVDFQRNESQSILAELRVGGGGGVQVLPMDLGLETEHQIFDASIPLVPLESLIDLPSHKLRQLGRSHHPQS